MKLNQLGGQFVIANLCALNIGEHSTYGWMVSTRKDDMGFSTFYGPDLSETIQRALKNGPQLPPAIELDDEANSLL